MNHPIEKREYTALIYANGDYPSRMFASSLRKDADLIIAADGAAETLKGIGIDPDLIVGDLDSISPETLSYFKEKGIEIKQYPKEKDETDLEIALERAKDKGATRVIVTGVTGGRMDHAVTNLNILEAASDLGIKAEIHEPQDTLYYLEGPAKMSFDLPEGTLVSILPLSKRVEGVSLEGFYYPLHDAILERKKAGLSVSNIVTKSPCTISLVRGEVLVDVVSIKN